MKVVLLVIACLLCLTSASSIAQSPPSVTGLLDRYLRGEFDAVMTVVSAQNDFKAILEGLKEHGAAWVDAEGPATHERRQLAAATFALEAARLDARNAWKVRQHFEIHPRAPNQSGPPLILKAEMLYWQPSPLLLEWGCALLRADPTPQPIERIWQLAALSVAERAEDPEFLVGAGATPLGPDNPREEVDHLRHIQIRFPDEPRFRLGIGIAFEWITFPGAREPQEARRILGLLQDDEDVGSEATVRLGYLHARMGEDDRALSLFDRVPANTLDPWVLYLASYFKGQVLERKDRPLDAERAYRAALAAVPGAESASVALATLLFKHDRRSEAASIVATMFGTKPQAIDPWREYPNADDRFWPELIARLHTEIAR